MAIRAESLEVEVSARGVDTTVRDLNRVPSAAQKAGQGVDRAGNIAQSGGRKFSAAGALVKAAAGTMAISLGTKVITSASDLNEELSKTGVVFGPAADKVISKANQMARQFGINKAEFLGAAGGIGLVAKASGMAQAPAAKLANNLGMLAADASSFYNVPMAEALDAMKSGLVGEAEPMRRFGVLLSENALKQEALRQKMVLVNGEMSEGQKVQARASLIMRGMTDASGDLARTQDSVSNRLREVQGRISNYAAELGTKALPYVSDFLGMMIESAPAIEKYARGLAQDLTPAFNTLVSVGSGVLSTGRELLDIFNSLPQPIQGMAGELALAALVVPKLMGPIGSLTTQLSTMGTNLRTAEGRASAFQSAMSGLKMAGAVGGVTLLGDAAQHTGTQLGTLENLAGGALLGFSMGGPIGAAIGAGAGGLRDLSSAATASWEAMKAGMKFQQGYRDSLNQTNAAITEQTRRIAFQNLQNSEALKVGRLIGLKDRDMVSAALGNADALARVERRVKSLTGSQKELANAKPGELFFNQANAQSYIASLKNMGVELDKDQRALLRANAAVQKWKDALKGVPPKVQTKMEAQDYDLTLGQVRKLQRQYDLTPKQVRTIVEALGMDKVRVDAEGNIRRLKDLDRQRPKPVADLTDAQIKSKTAAADRALKALGGYTARPGATLNDQVTAAVARARNSLDSLNGKVATTYIKTITLAQGKSDAMMAKADGGEVTGQRYPYGDKVLAMLAPGEEVISNRHGQADQFRRDRAAGLIPRYAEGGTVGGKGNPAAGIKDPERRKEILGLLIEIRDLRKSLAVTGKDALTGLERKRTEAELAATLRDLRAAKTPPKPPKPEGWGLLGNMADGIKKAIDGSEVLRQFRDIIKANTKGKETKDLLNHKLLDKMAAKNHRLAEVQEKLAQRIAERDALQAKADDFRGSVTEGISRQANVLNAGRTAGDIAGSLGVQVGKAQEFAAAIQALRSKGYSDGIVMQVASAGIEGGLEVAKALMAASPGEAQAITQSFNTIQSIAAQAAGGVTGQMYDTGLDAANGLVKGLEDREAKIEATLVRIAEKMAKVLRKRLKSRSPSRLMAEVSHDVGDGLVVGLKEREQRIARKAADIGSLLAAGVKGGLGAPPRLPGGPVGAQGLTPASLGVGGGGAPVTFHFQTYNPVAEPESRTTNKALDRVAAVGLV